MKFHPPFKQKIELIFCIGHFADAVTMILYFTVILPFLFLLY